MGQVNRKVAWTVVLLLLGFLSAFAAYLVLADSAAWRFILRVWLDKAFLKETVQGWGYMGPVVFVVVQALQVIVSPIPGEATGLAGGFFFGTPPWASSTPPSGSRWAPSRASASGAGWGPPSSSASWPSTTGKRWDSSWRRKAPSWASSCI